MSGAGVAKTVSFSPLRAKQASVKIALDAPYQLKWPHIAPDKIECLFDELKRSLSGVKELLSVKYQTTSSANGRRKRGRKRKRGQREKEREGHVNEPVAKKLCLETATDESPVTPQSEIDESASTFDLLQSSRKSQLVVGTNAFTRSLEEGTLRVGVVCLSAKPALIHKHILQLSATRKVPVVALADLSSTIAPLLGMKSALAIGVKKVAEGEMDGYAELVAMVTNIAPPISIPWLTSDLKGDKASYIQLNVKKTLSRPKDR